MTDWLRTAWNAQSRKHSQSRKQRHRPKRRRGLQRHVESLEARRLLAADVVSLEETQTLAEHAKSIWESTGLSSEQIQELESLQYQVADLGENKLAQYRVGVITIDDNAAGNLWFVDQTPLVNEEFHEVDGVFTANTATLAMGKIDLLTALLHEQGHALGLDGRVESGDVMNDGLQSGIRGLPFMDQAAEADPGSIQTVEYLTSVSTGGNQSIDNRMPYGTVNYVVALTGLFPSRNLTDSEPMIGSVEMFAGNFAPRGYALAHGQLLPIAQNTALFSILGTTYGGDGQTTFGLPDLQGRVPIGAGQGPGLANYSLGQKGGVETNTLAANQLINHTHTVGGSGAITSAGDATSVTIDNRQPYLALTPAIALVGVFPSRNLGSDPGIGSVGWFAGNFAPRGWAKAEGQLLDIASYNALFSILGTTYGGDGRTTFGLPDLRGRAAVHYGTGPGLPNISLGQKAGSEQSVLTVSHLPTHSHGIPDAPISTDDSGGGQSFDNHQPILGLNYNIALQGTFPSRNLDSGEDDTQFDDEDTIGVGFVSGTLVLDETDALPMIEAIVQEGIDRWASVGISDEQIAQLQATEIRLRDLASGRLASADVDVITIDRDASNRGWFLDATPGDDFEFGEIDPRTGELVATAEGTQGHYDLLTAIMHEQGHILGLEHTEMPGELMYGGLLTGGRRLPDASYLVIADQDEHDGDTASYLAGGEPALASIGIFAGNFNPRGWAKTDGQILPINQNQALFSLLGTTYGGDGGTTFGLPELRGRAVVGEGQLQVIGGTNYQLGQRGGTPSTTLTPTQMPVHDHDIPTGNPVANNDNGPDLMENGGAGSVNILANDTDPNGNPSAPINGATAFSVDLDQTTDGIQTSLTNDQGEWTLDTGTGVVTFTPAADFDGRASIVYTLTDYTGQSDKANITFAVRAASGDVVVNLPSGGGSVNVVLEGTEIVVRRGVMELSRTPVSTTTRLTINGTDASDDTLRIDLSGGNPIPEGGLHFNGGVGGDDALVVVNGGEIDTDYQTSGEQSGEIDIDGRIVTFENLEPLDFTGIVAGNVMITVDAFLVTGSEVITTISANGSNTLISFDTTGGLESIEFGVINGTLTINLDKTDIDVVNVEGLGSSFAGNLVINGDVLDTVNFTGAIDLGGRDLMVSGKQIDVFASLQSSGGNVSFVANDVNLQNSVDVGGGTVGMTPMTPGAVVDLGTQVSGGVNKVYWVDASSDLVGRADVNALNSNVETVVSVTGSTPNLSVPTGIGLDPATGKVYFSDTGNDFIARADFAAFNSNVQTLLDPIGFSNDVTIAGGKLYWIDTNAGFDHIVRSDLDGSNPEVLVDGLDSPQGIAVDVAGGKVYWSDSNDDHIQRADINGDLASNNISKEDVVTGVIFPEGISLDLVNRKIYFVDDSTADRIVRADMDGVNSNVEEVVTGLTSPNGIAVDPIGGKVYWSDAGSGFDHIARADIDLSGGPNNNVEEIVTGLGTPNKIDLLYDTGNFTLTDAELNRITANTLIIGNAASGDVTITSEINPVNITTLQIVSGGMIGDTNTTTTDIDAAHVILSGNVAPGNSPGILSVVGNFSLADDDTFTVEIGGTTAGNGAGFHDQIDVAGTVAIGANVTLSLAGVGGFAATAGDAFTIIKNDGTADAVTGTFAGLAEGATILNILGSGMDATISYVAGDGNDVVITIVNPVADYGDAPTAVQAGGGTFVSDYPVTLADNGARHDDLGPTLGASRDVEPDGIPDPGAFGDDNDNSDDEDGIQLPANLFAFTTNSSTPSLTVDLQSPDPVSNILNGWIDFNRDGDWDDVGEQIFTDFDLGTSAGIQSISFSVPQDSGANFEDGTSYARFRLNTTGGLTPTGAAADGEVEDYAINLVSLVGDFGDAPTAAQAGGGTFVNDYPTTLADDGARHAFSNGPFLGNSIDYEKDGIPTTSADGDDSNGIDDENGIAIGVQLSSSISGTMTEIGVTSSGPGLLDGWIDWNRDGDWDDNGERILINQPVATGTNTLTYLVPQDTGTNVLSGTTFARFRISTAGVAGVTGAAPDGEVEDYQVTVLNVNGSVDTAGNLIIQDNDGSRNDDITIEIDGPNYRITDPVNGFVAGSGAAQDGPNSMLVPIANVTGEIRVIGGGGDDSLTINNNGGRIQRPIVYDGGGQGAMGDSLTVVNDANPATLQVLSYTNANDGNVVLDGVAITYTGLEPIIAGNAADTILNLPDVTVNTATLQNSAVAGEIEIVGATFEDTVIPNPTNSLTVNLGDAGDSLTIDALDGAFAATLEVNGGVLNDVVDASNLTTSLTINGGAGNDQLTGSTANDVINGGDDIDTIHGNSGNDTITGGLGADMQFGDAGDDTFVWNNGDGPDDNTGGADTDTFTFNGADGADDVLSLLAGVGDGSLGGAAFHLARTAPSAFTIEGVEIEDVNINGLAGADDITVVPFATLNVAVDGGDPATFPGDVLTVDVAGTTGANLDVSGPQAGEFSFTSAHNIVYSDIEAIASVNGSFATNAINTGLGDDDIVLRLDGLDTVVTVGGAEFFRTPTANLAELTINGEAGDDTFTVDYVNGNPIPAGGLFFNGNGQGVGGDTVLLQNGNVTNVHHTFANDHDGSVDIDGSMLTYTGLEPIVDNLGAVDRIFTFTGGSETITLGDDLGAVVNVSRIDSTLGESVDFINPTNSLTVNTGSGTDLLNVTTLDAAYAASLILHGGDGATDVVTMTNVNLINTPGRGLWIQEFETIAMTGGTLSGNTAVNGGGLLIDNSTSATTTATLSGVTISGNTATGGTAPLEGGGGIYNNGAILNIIAGSTISGNFAITGQGSGGGILSTGTLTISDSSLVDNDANRAGGGIEIATGSGLTTLTDVTLDRNDALAGPGNGGGLHVSGAGNVAVVRGFVRDNTAAAEGGGLWNGGGTLTINGTTMSGNVASGAAADQGGGGVFNDSGVLDIDNAIIQDNEADGVSGSGGGVFTLDGTVRIDNSTIQSNSANRAGGGIEIVAGTVTLSNVQLLSNDVDGMGTTATTPNPGNGGALHVTATATVTLAGGLVQGNLAREEGGGLWNSITGTMIIDNVSLDSNVARAAAGGLDQGGGGVFNNGGEVTIRNNTSITNNLATDNLGNGGGAMTVGGTVTIQNSALTGNQAARAGGGIENNAGDVSLTGVNVGGVNVADGNTAGINGGGLHASDAASVTTVTGGLFQNNLAQQEGGGLWNGDGLLRINNTTITQNTANSANNVGNDQGGGGVFNIGGTLDINSVLITANEALANNGNGGAVMTVGGTVTIDDSSLQSNAAGRAGGGIENNDGQVTVTNETVGGPAAAVGNTAAVNGGGLHAGGNNSVTIVNGGLFQNNVAGEEGGGLWNGSGLMTINGTQILDNTANSGNNVGNDQGGGGVFNIDGTLDIDNATISGNVATLNSGNGGGVMTVGGTVTIDDTLLQSNEAARAGGGIENNNGNVTVTASEVGGANVAEGNTAGINGGGLHASGGASVTIVDGGTFQNNVAQQEGGGLWNGPGTMTIRNHTLISDNTANSSDNAGNDQGGGGVFNIGGTLDIDDATITENLATANGGNGGGVMTVGGTVTVDNTFVGSNEAGRDGGGLHASGASDVTVSGGSFRLNTAAEEGGGLWNGAGTLRIDGTLVTENTANSGDNGGNDQGGGGVFNIGGNLAITNATLTSNLATANNGNGGGLMTVGGTVTIDDTSIQNNDAARAGGGVENNAGNVTLSNVTLGGPTPADGNTAGINGGGLHASGVASVTVVDGGTVRNNIADQEGGGLWNGDGQMIINGTTITENTARSGNNASNDQGGGGVFNIGGSLKIDDATITNNLATENNGNGGGVMTVGGGVVINGGSIASNQAARAGGGVENNNGSVSLSGVLVGGPNPDDGNIAGINGGGLHASGDSETTIRNAVFENNVADQEGGGIWNGAQGTLTINGGAILSNLANSTDAANSAQGGGGIFNDGGLLALREGVVVANNTALDPDGSTTQDDGGGGIFNHGGVVTVTGSTTQIRGNMALDGSGNGGGILNLGGEVTIEEATIAGNQSARAGGGLETINGVVALNDATFGGPNPTDGNTAGINGGGLHVSGQATIHITGGNFQSNTAAEEGGGLWNSAAGTMSITGTSIQNNTASGNASDQGGGGVFNAGGVLNLTEVTIRGNTANGTSGSGGGIFNDATGSLSVTDSVISMNQANRAGGGIETTAGTTNTLTNVSLDQNNAGLAPAVASPGNGGGLHVSGDGDVTITGGSVNGNTAAEEGGGLWNGAGTLIVTSTDIDGNRANGTGVDQGGGGVFNSSGVVSLHNVKLNNNIANVATGSGGGAFNDSGTLNIRNSEIINNDSGGLAYRTFSGIIVNNDVSGNTNGGLHLLAGTSGDDVIKITSNLIDINGATLNYDATLGPISIQTGDGNDEVIIQSTNATTPITVDTGAGNDTIRISSDAPTNAGTLNEIRGDITIIGGFQTSTTDVTETVSARDSVGGSQTHSATALVGDQLFISDASASTTNNYLLNANTFTRIGYGVITFDTIESVDITTGNGNDTVTITDTNEASQLTLRTLGGDDVVSIAATGDASILRVASQNGDDTISVQSTGVGSVLLVDTGHQDDSVTIVNRGMSSGIDVRTGNGKDTITLGDMLTAATVDVGSPSIINIEGGENDDQFVVYEVFSTSVVELQGSGGNDDFLLSASDSNPDGTLTRFNDAANTRQLLIDGGTNGNDIRTFYEGITVNATGKKNEPQVRDQATGDKITVDATSLTAALDLRYQIMASGQGLLSTGSNEVLDSIGVETIELNTGAGDDSLNMTSDIAFGIESSQQAIAFNGGTGDNQLVVTGTDQDDRITVGSSVDASIEPIEVDQVESVTVNGGNGNDQLSNRLDTPATLNGDDGDNIILGGFAIDTLSAGAGESLLFGRLDGEIVRQRGEGEIVFDVNGDGKITAVDPLQVINKLNAMGHQNGEATSEPTISSRKYISHLDDADVNADGRVSALDALMIINRLNSFDTFTTSESNAEPLLDLPLPQTPTGLESDIDSNPKTVTPSTFGSTSLDTKTVSDPVSADQWGLAVDEAFEQDEEPTDESDLPFWELANDLY